MYDFSHIKSRLHKEMECLLSCDEWKPEHVCVMKELLRCDQHIEEIETMEYAEEQRMKPHEQEHMSADSVSATGVAVKR